MEDGLVHTGRIADQVDELLDGSVKDEVGIKILGHNPLGLH